MEASVFIATSLDGFIAREDGGLDWLDRANSLVPEGEDCGYGAFIKTIDHIVMGSGSFEKVQAFEPWPYSLPVTVMSRRGVEVLDGLEGDVASSTESPRELFERLRKEGMQRIYVDGGRLIQAFLREGLISDMTITTIPVLLGTGRPLFGEVASDIACEHVETKAYSCGFVQSSYRLRN